MVPMRDGVRLSTDLYFPEAVDGPLPVILIRTAYNKKGFHQETKTGAHLFAGQGYVVAVQDLRGRFESEGLFFACSKHDRSDGYDTVDWLARQPWSTGKIGTYGCSYLGEVQDKLAATRHPNHVAAIPQSGSAYGGGGVRGFGFRRYGALELAASVGWTRGSGSKVFYRPPSGLSREEFVKLSVYFDPAPRVPDVDLMPFLRTLPIIDILKKAGAPPTDFEDWVSHEPGDPYWDEQGSVLEHDRFDVPAIHVNSWYDVTVNATLNVFRLFRQNADSARARDNQFLIMSPASHCASESLGAPTVVGQRNLGDARFDYYGLYLRWFDYWLRGEENGVTDMSKVQIYVMGKNEWRGESEWPLARTRFTKYYLRSDGGANSRFGTGVLSTELPVDESVDEYVYDPENPVPSVGGGICCVRGEFAQPGGFDQSDVETRQDVLVYTTEPLERGIEVTGPVTAVLYISSSTTDTDFTAKLVDVYPDGVAYNVQEGILRARYRESVDRAVLMDPGRVYEITVDLESTSNYFGPGHRIRLEISSSNFPRWDRNLNTGGPNYSETKWVVAKNRIHHSGEHASHLLLPIISD